MINNYDKYHSIAKDNIGTCKERSYIEYIVALYLIQIHVLEISLVLRKICYYIGCLCHDVVLRALDLKGKETNVEEADGLDGVLLAMQRDVRWREDIFDGWHFL